MRNRQIYDRQRDRTTKSEEQTDIYRERGEGGRELQRERVNYTLHSLSLTTKIVNALLPISCHVAAIDPLMPVVQEVRKSCRMSSVLLMSEIIILTQPAGYQGHHLEDM